MAMALEECRSMEGLCKGREEEEEDALDAALESVFVASLSSSSSTNRDVVVDAKSCQEEFGTESTSPKPRAATPFRLIFSFPGWGVDICRDWKRRRPSVLRHTAFKSAEEGSVVQQNGQKHTKSAAMVWCEEPSPTDGCPISEVPDELLANVLLKLEMRDLCSAMQTCRRWHCVGSLDVIWERFSPSATDAKDCEAVNKFSRRLIVKNYTLSSQLSKRYTYFRKGYDHLRCVLNDWWELGRPDGRYSSSMMHSLIRRLTAQDWTLVYEAFGAAFTHRTDCLATTMFEALKKARSHNKISSEIVPYCQEQRAIKQASVKYIKICNSFKDETPDICESSGMESDAQSLAVGGGPAGKELWKLLYDLWDRYKYWLTLIFSHCADLNHEVMVERARGAAFSATPTVYDKGVISFRSQVVLRFGIRAPLQAGFSWLSAQDHHGCASDLDVELLRSLHHMLQELDVPDDYTLCETNYTQLKLRRCFTTPRLFNHKLIQPCSKVDKFSSRPYFC